MKFLTIEIETRSSQIIINLDNIDHIEMNTHAITCKVFFASGNTLMLHGNELAALIRGLKQYNDQLLVNLCKEEEF